MGRAVIVLLCMASCDSHGADARPADRQPTLLRDWMKAEMPHRVRARDFDGLARAFDLLATLGPAELDRWQQIAGTGARAARAGDIEAVRHTCATCHATYRSEYRARWHARSITVETRTER